MNAYCIGQMPNFSHPRTHAPTRTYPCTNFNPLSRSPRRRPPQPELYEDLKDVPGARIDSPTLLESVMAQEMQEEAYVIAGGEYLVTFGVNGDPPWVGTVVLVPTGGASPDDITLNIKRNPAPESEPYRAPSAAPQQKLATAPEDAATARAAVLRDKTARQTQPQAHRAALKVAPDEQEMPTHVGANVGHKVAAPKPGGERAKFLRATQAAGAVGVEAAPADLSASQAVAQKPQQTLPLALEAEHTACENAHAAQLAPASKHQAPSVQSQAGDKPAEANVTHFAAALKNTSHKADDIDSSAGSVAERQATLDQNAEDQKATCGDCGADALRPELLQRVGVNGTQALTRETLVEVVPCGLELRLLLQTAGKSSDSTLLGTQVLVRSKFGLAPQTWEGQEGAEPMLKAGISRASTLADISRIVQRKHEEAAANNPVLQQNDISPSQLQGAHVTQPNPHERAADAMLAGSSGTAASKQTVGGTLPSMAAEDISDGEDRQRAAAKQTTEEATHEDDTSAPTPVTVVLVLTGGASPEDILPTLKHDPAPKSEPYRASSAAPHQKLATAPEDAATARAAALRDKRARQTQPQAHRAALKVAPDEQEMPTHVGANVGHKVAAPKPGGERAKFLRATQAAGAVGVEAAPADLSASQAVAQKPQQTLPLALEAEHTACENAHAAQLAPASKHQAPSVQSQAGDKPAEANVTHFAAALKNTSHKADDIDSSAGSVAERQATLDQNAEDQKATCGDCGADALRPELLQRVGVNGTQALTRETLVEVVPCGLELRLLLQTAGKSSDSTLLGTQVLVRSKFGLAPQTWEGQEGAEPMLKAGISRASTLADISRIVQRKHEEAAANNPVLQQNDISPSQLQGAHVTQPNPHERAADAMLAGSSGTAASKQTVGGTLPSMAAEDISDGEDRQRAAAKPTTEEATHERRWLHPADERETGTHTTGQAYDGDLFETGDHFQTAALLEAHISSVAPPDAASCWEGGAGVDGRPPARAPVLSHFLVPLEKPAAKFLRSYEDAGETVPVEIYFFRERCVARDSFRRAFPSAQMFYMRLSYHCAAPFRGARCYATTRGFLCPCGVPCSR